MRREWTKKEKEKNDNNDSASGGQSREQSVQRSNTDMENVRWGKPG